jgi:hypothetical protein
MKKIMAAPFLLSVFFSFQISAQVKQDTIMYAMSASTDDQLAWLNIERFDIKACKKNSEIFNKGHHKYILNNDPNSFDENINKCTRDFFNDHFPTSYMACGIAYSKKTNRVYFFPLGKNELGWIDINDSSDSVKKFGKITSNQIYTSQDNYSTEDANVSRATMGLNGKGYAITNDGKHLYEFTDEDVPVITDLGPLEDSSENENHACEQNNWGGDIVGLTDGNLLLITGNGKIFSIDIKTREATFLFTIKGLHKNIIISGAAVDDQNQLIISGSHGGDGFYKVTIGFGASATKVENTQMSYSVSDLTSANLLTLPEKVKGFLGNVTIDPNPIQNNSFKILMNGTEAGNYSLRISDQNGKAIASSQFEVSSANAVIEQSIPVLPAGIYYFLIYDSKNEVVFHDKILVSN